MTINFGQQMMAGVVGQKFRGAREAIESKLRIDRKYLRPKIRRQNQEPALFSESQPESTLNDTNAAPSETTDTVTAEPYTIGDDQKGTPREYYIRSIGLKHDPFRDPVAEKEYDSMVVRAGESTPYFTPFAYYVDPLYGDHREGLTFKRLRQKKALLLFADKGMGKSTLRLATETNIRTRRDGTLVVTYKPSKLLGQEARTISLNEHLVGIVRELATDLFIQIVERFRINFVPSQEMNRRLCKLIKSSDPDLGDVVGQMISEQENLSSGSWGYGEYWALLNRMPVKAISSSPELTKWFAALRMHHSREHSVPARSAQEQWDAALAAAHAWGFARIFITVDSVDDLDRTPDEMMGVVANLVDYVAGFSADDVYLKLFLPAELEEPLLTRFDQENPARDCFDVLELKWSEERLRALLRARFTAARARRSRLGGMSDREFGSQVDDLLIEAANGSPRRLLELTDNLIKAHTSQSLYEAPDLPLTRENWNMAVAAVTRAEAF